MSIKKKQTIPASYRLPKELLADLRDIAGDEWGAQTAIVISGLRKEVAARKRRREAKEQALATS